MSLLSKPAKVDEKEKEEFQGVAMLHVSRQNSKQAHLTFVIGTLRIH
jgi:hypothetical protein